VKFLVDAQLPARLARALLAAGHDAVHTLDLPKGNRSTDRTVAEAADADDRVLVTKDGDFRDSHRLRASPRRLLIVTTGNIGNDELLAIFGRHLGLLVTALESAGMVELGHDSVEIFEEPEL
jgi:predicted nuclease of predicted toxin-antitoxin system